EAGYRGVLLDVGSTDVSVVSTDRFLLVARLAVATSIQGPPVRVNVAPGTSIAWLRRRRHVDLVVEAPIGRDGTSALRAHFRSPGGDRLELACEPELLPSVHWLPEEVDSVTTRAAFRRQDVVRLARTAAEPVLLIVEDGVARIRSDAGAVD